MTTMDESMFATHSLDSVPYSAGRTKLHMLKSRAPVYLLIILSPYNLVQRYQYMYSRIAMPGQFQIATNLLPPWQRGGRLFTISTTFLTLRPFDVVYHAQRAVFLRT